MYFFVYILLKSTSYGYGTKVAILYTKQFLLFRVLSEDQFATRDQSFFENPSGFKFFGGLLNFGFNSLINSYSLFTNAEERL